LVFTADKPWNKLIVAGQSEGGDGRLLQSSNVREEKILANSTAHGGFRTSICFE